MSTRTRKMRQYTNDHQVDATVTGLRMIVDLLSEFIKLKTYRRQAWQIDVEMLIRAKEHSIGILKN